MVSENTKDYLGVTGLTGFFLIISIVVPFVIGFLEKGFDSAEIITQYTVYASVSVAFMAIFMLWLYAKKLNSSYGNSLFFASKGESPSIPFFKRFSYPQLILGSTVIFGFLFLIVSQLKETAFTGFKVVQQQFTPGASIVFSAFLVPSPENAVLGALIAGLAVTMMTLGKKYHWSKANYNGFIYLLIPLAGGALGLGMHLLRYGANTWNLYVVFGFWTVLALLSVMTGTFVVGWILHVMNNLFFDLKIYFSNETVFLIGFAVLVLLAILYFTLYKGELMGSVKNE
ncbi:MAG: hypothetical protein GXO79_11525 [Chlorobi bacterium]|nr:hypothetical protein [Chlorobiota bacterium]